MLPLFTGNMETWIRAARKVAITEITTVLAGIAPPPQKDHNNNIVPVRLPLYRFRQEHRCIAIVTDHISHQGRRYSREFGRAGKEDRFQSRFQHPVHIGDGLLVFEVADIPYTAEDKACADLLAKIDRKTFVSGYLDTRIIFKAFFYPGYPLLGSEHGLLVGIDAHTDHQLVEQGYGALDNVDVSFGDRVERAGEQADTLHEILH